MYAHKRVLELIVFFQHGFEEKAYRLHKSKEDKSPQRPKTKADLEDELKMMKQLTDAMEEDTKH